MKTPCHVIFVTRFHQEHPGWEYHKNIERVGRKALLRALEVEEK